MHLLRRQALTRAAPSCPAHTRCYQREPPALTPPLPCAKYCCCSKARVPSDSAASPAAITAFSCAARFTAPVIIIMLPFK